MTRTIAALFENVDVAERAAHDLAMRVAWVRGKV
jgi:hypothetical protein